MKEPDQIAIYSRKSRFTGKGESIENQIEMCRQYIRLHFGDAAADRAQVYEDEGFSGGTLERPQFKKMMAEAKHGSFRAVIVYRLDRISRNIGDFAGLIEELNTMKVDFISIKEQFDTSSPLGRAMMYISSVFSQLERETIAERIRDNMHELAKSGRWLGGVTPTGYESESISHITIDGKPKKACKLKIIPDEISVVKLIFEKFLETGSLTKTEAFLLQNGYVTRRSNQFTRFAVKGILSNPVYLIADEAAYAYLTDHEVELFSEKAAFHGAAGVMVYNRTLQQAGKANQIKPMTEWIVAVGRHQGVIAGADWVKVQAMLNQNRSKSYRRPRSNAALLSGLLLCGNCGEYMRPKLSSRRDAAGKPVYAYLCSLKERSKSQCCCMKNCDGNAADAAVLEQLGALSGDQAAFVQQLDGGAKQLGGSRNQYDAEVGKLEQQIQETDVEITGLIAALTKAAGSAAEEYILKQIEQLHQKKAAMLNRLEDLRALSAMSPLGQDEFALLVQMLSSFGEMVQRMTVEQKRAAIRTFVKQVVWDGKDLHVVLFGADYPYAFAHRPSALPSAPVQEPDSHACDAEPLRENSK